MAYKIRELLEREEEWARSEKKYYLEISSSLNINTCTHTYVQHIYREIKKKKRNQNENIPKKKKALQRFLYFPIIFHNRVDFEFYSVGLFIK